MQRKDIALGAAVGLGVAVAVLYFQFWVSRFPFNWLFLVPYIAVVLIAALSAARMEQMFSPGVSLAGLLGKLYIAIASATLAIIGAGLLFSLAAELTLLVTQSKLGRLLDVLATSFFAAVLFATSTWPILGASIAVTTVSAYLYQRLAPNNSFKPKPLRGSA